MRPSINQSPFSKVELYSDAKHLKLHSTNSYVHTQTHSKFSTQIIALWTDSIYMLLSPYITSTANTSSLDVKRKHSSATAFIPRLERANNMQKSKHLRSTYWENHHWHSLCTQCEIELNYSPCVNYNYATISKIKKLYIIVMFICLYNLALI